MHVGVWDNMPLDSPFELKTSDFISFAEEDLKEDDEKPLINAEARHRLEKQKATTGATFTTEHNPKKTSSPYHPIKRLRLFAKRCIFYNDMYA